MNDTYLSPFAPKRYEHDGNHVYFLPPSVFGLLEAPIPTFLVGTRGTGKTTLLHALNWSERLDNQWLRSQVDEPFAASYIGLYFKLPEIQLALLDGWLEDARDADYAAIFAFYLDLCWLETVLPSLRHMEASQLIRVRSKDEHQFIDQLEEYWTQYPTLLELVGPQPSSIAGFLTLVPAIRQVIERFARREVDYRDVFDHFPIGQVGSFGRKVGSFIARTLDLGCEADRPQWSFRVCMDEGEGLTLRQQRVVNSMVRLAEWPVFYVVAYLSRPHDVTGTFLPNQTLQAADRQILILDEMGEAEFRSLAEGVVNVRLSALGVTKRFRSWSALGRLNLNSLLQRILRKSEGDFAAQLLELSRQLHETEQVPPIYETYLEMNSLGSVPKDSSRRQVRKQASATTRKRNVAAYLSICSEAKSKPMYASADMVLQMSDNCVRDFLRQMEFIHRESGRPSIDEFLSKPIPEVVQDRGIRGAAEFKMTLFGERVVSYPMEANQLVAGLARVTEIIQTSGRNFEHIRTPERGIFTYRGTPSDRAPSSNEMLIRDAAEAGFLRLLPDEGSGEIKFRVHSSLAPEYGFSYRGAYYDACVLSDSEIEMFRSARNSNETDHAVQALTARLGARRPRRTQPSPSGQPTITGLEED